MVATTDRAIPSVMDCLRRYALESSRVEVEASDANTGEVHKEREGVLTTVGAAGRGAINPGGDALCLVGGVMLSRNEIREECSGFPVGHTTPAAVPLAD